LFFDFAPATISTACRGNLKIFASSRINSRLAASSTGGDAHAQSPLMRTIHFAARGARHNANRKCEDAVSLRVPNHVRL